MKSFKYMDIKWKVKKVAVVVATFTLLSACSDKLEESKEQLAADNIPTVTAEKPQDINHENLLYKVNFYADLVRNVYKGKPVSFARFAQLKQNFEKELTPRCNTYDLLVERTGGNYKSPYATERVDCKDVVLGMTQYLFAIRDNDKARMKSQLTNLNAIVSRLEKSLEQYKKSDAEIEALMASFKSN